MIKSKFAEVNLYLTPDFGHTHRLMYQLFPNNSGNIYPMKLKLF